MPRNTPAAAKAKANADDPKPFSPMHPMYLLFEHKGLYYYSSNCCVPSDPHSGQIVSNVAISGLGCPPPNDGGGGETGGRSRAGIEVNYVAKVHNGQDIDGNNKYRDGIGFGYFHDDSGGFGGLPIAPEDLVIVPGVGHAEPFSAGRSFVLVDSKGDSIHAMDRVFRIWMVRDWYRSTVLLVAFPFKKPTGLNPRKQGLVEFEQGAIVDVPIHCGCGSIALMPDDPSIPHIDILVVDHP